MQSNIGDKTGLYIFPGLGVGKNASRQEKNEAMKRMSEKIAANPSGILMYHAPGRPFAFGKSLGIEFGTELLESISVVFLLAQTRIASFAGRVGFVFVAGILAAITTNVSYWNWYGLHRQLYADRDCGFHPCWSCCRAGAAKAQSGNLKLMSFST